MYKEMPLGDRLPWRGKSPSGRGLGSLPRLGRRVWKWATPHWNLVTKVLRHPDRVVLRLILRARMARTSLAVDHARLLSWVSEQFEVDAAALHAEYMSSDFYRVYTARREELRAYVGPQRLGTSGGLTLEALYLVVRAARPQVVVETGVLYGATSAHILAALARNGQGELYSIDLPDQPREPGHDFLVPEDLRGRWTPVIGDARDVLPPLLTRLPALDLFYHDSLHTFEHMTWEYSTALAHLSPGGMLSSHDVRTTHSVREIFRRNAFPTFCEQRGLVWRIFRNSGFALRA
jgi:predicted O-methyltransferase YrrM